MLLGGLKSLLGVGLSVYMTTISRLYDDN
jgi:hypothetical protein